MTKQIVISPDMTEKFNASFTRIDKCWIWCGVFTGGGKSQPRLIMGPGARNVGAHRYSYVLHKGEFDPTMRIDHTCHNSSCVNPDHLEAVTVAESYRRRTEHRRATITHCKYGHLYEIPEPGKVLKCHVCTKATYVERRDGVDRVEALARLEANPKLVNSNTSSKIDWSKPQHCTECYRKVYNDKKDKTPDSRRYGSRGMCAGCYRKTLDYGGAYIRDEAGEPITKHTTFPLFTSDRDLPKIGY